MLLHLNAYKKIELLRREMWMVLAVIKHANLHQLRISPLIS